jgi:serine/threonine-protein kinase RsbW
MGRTVGRTVNIPSSLDGIRQAVDAVDRWCEATGVPAPHRRRVLTALDEVLSNVVRHGYGDRPGAIDVAFAREAEIVLVDVADAGPPFDPLAAPAPDTSAPLDDRRVGGLGIALVRALADDVRYDRRDGRNYLSMIWRIHR